MAIPPPPAGWNERLLSQLTFHWDHQLRPGLEGLTDDEYFWEPVADCWSVRPRAEARTELVGGSGPWVAELAFPEPDPGPFTTIAWRLAHVVVGVLGMRNAAHFDGPPVGYLDFDYAGTATEALAQLDDGYARWVDGVRRLGDDGLEVAVGTAEGPFAAHTYADLVLHIHREVLHHGAEVLVLRDQYRASASV